MIERLTWLAVAFGSCLALAVCVSAGADQVRLAVTADTSLQAHSQEINCNSGASSAIRIKGIEHFMLAKFDLAPIRGWEVQRAVLRLHAAHEHLLLRIGLSTISADWEEGTGHGGQATDGCTFTRAAWPNTFWAGPGSDFLSVALTMGNTFMCYTQLTQLPDGWLEIPVDPVLVYAMLSGDSYGLCISDEIGQTRANNDVHSREQNASAPYLVVEGRPGGDAAPLPALGPVSAEPWPAAATFGHGAVRLKFTAPDCFRYEILLVAANKLQEPSPLARFLTPHPAPAGQEQAIVVPGLAPSEAVEVGVTPVDRFGRSGEGRTVEVTASAAKPAPAPLALPPESPPAGKEPEAVAGLRAWACPGECKVNPVNGNVLEEVGGDAYGGEAQGRYRLGNPAWSAGQALMGGARGEVVALEVVVESAARGPRELKLEYAGSGGLPQPVSFGRDWYVRAGPAPGQWFGEYLVPLSEGKAQLPAPDNKVEGQRNQVFTLIWEVPREAEPGVLSGELKITAADAPGQTLGVPIQLAVRDLSLPAETSFEVSLNCYGPVIGEPNWDRYLMLERKYYAAAHALRGTLVSLGYSHSGNTDYGWVPALTGQGAEMQVSDWSVWDRHWGPYLDGSAFGGVRAGVPISHLYLPLHEAWPTPIAGHYTGGNDIHRFPDNLIAHAFAAPPVEKAFDQTLQDAFVAVTRQFAEHFRRQGWTHTMLQCYQNDKNDYKGPQGGFRGTSWWLLDEPMHRDDWLALRFLGQLFHRGADETPFMKVRADVSRPQWQRDWLDGVVDLMCVASELFDHPQHCRRYRDQGVTLWEYGSANSIEDSNLTGEAWALHVYWGGADGIVPWNSIGGDGAFERPEPTALFVPGMRFGVDGPVISLRLLGLCRGQQDVEYLNLLAKKRGYDRDQMALLVDHLLRESSARLLETLIRPGDETRSLFPNLTCEQMARFRRAVAEELAR